MSVGSCRAAAVQCQHGSPCNGVPYISPTLEYTTGSNTGGLQVTTHYGACLQQSQMNATSNGLQPSVHSKENKIFLALNNQAALQLQTRSCPTLSPFFSKLWIDILQERFHCSLQFSPLVGEHKCTPGYLWHHHGDFFIAVRGSAPALALAAGITHRG